MRFYADLHVHIGGTSGGMAVKITASRSLTFASILHECLMRKGIDMVGIVDCGAPNVIADIEYMLRSGDLGELKDGGLIFRDGLVVLPAVEVEVRAGEGNCHFVAYFPGLTEVKAFARQLEQVVTNVNLSSQKAGCTPDELASWVHAQGGLLFAAHAFTPHKGLIGCCTADPDRVFIEEKLDGIELGLSADTFLAERVSALRKYPFLSNSDAHSTGKIAREYNVLEMEKPTYMEFCRALKGQEGRKIRANYGLDPRLGKYHRTYCLACDQVAADPPPVLACPRCGTGKVVKGVRDRIEEIADCDKYGSHPPYLYQVPLEFVPGVGPKTLDRLIGAFGTEMAILHRAAEQELAQVVGGAIAGRIVAAREGRLALASGGGGTYGKVEGLQN